MSSMLGSQGLVLATAMAVSSMLVFLHFSRQKNFPPTQLSHQSPNQIPLRSCLYSRDRKRERKKKKVHFAENIEEEEQAGDGEEEEEPISIEKSKVETSCRNEIRRKIPANRIALYNGILKNRMQRMECSH
ncbi:hypothetical protein ACFX13_025758 [Malus domestica]|uniref:Uncharacterized protein n=1 Tax=Malus domestica TaxID=3750 RepID=A0A498HHI6_MALDO|nr:hypothetical protein DVH24_031288 [Malus domestica]